MNIRLNNTIRAMSVALDLAEINSIEDKNIIENISNINYSQHEFSHHSKRTAYIALKISSQFNLDKQSLNCLYIASLLHDIGITSASNLKICHTSEKFIKHHCISGANILKYFPIFNDISDIILYHHENHDGTGSMGLKESEIPFISQIIRISDLVELSYNEKLPAYKQKEHIVNWVKSKIGIIFSEEIGRAFLDVSSKDIFWFDLENISFMDLILDKIAPKLDLTLNLKDFEIIAEIFSRIIDAKSSFTAKHSREIAELAYKISKHIGYSEEKCTKMRIAGLLHDIGKLAIPSSILDKNGKLTHEEFSIIKSHVYYTSIILDKIEDIPEISAWASNHHEKLNSMGYPKSLSSEDLPEECRIMTVCDIYQALTEDRPYRKGLNIDQAFCILHEMCENNSICKNALDHLKNALL
ncbi:HD-GYP domain-containing protein [Clostridium ganghwense]|uniref:HD domain-containing protein n=1 Tax=Clostridium ganghwense TaxID=312089 RepID=A0ABT4CL67_9CLOT|nr:HD domain-containing phosphohydrolase [Clostridium ganghwense]MCY6369787.1 HD domain-containing protein [Clostridium ganghwense]